MLKKVNMSPPKKILLADDTYPIRIMLEEILTDAGYQVITAEDGEQAWRYLSDPRNKIDLLILDLLMPKMNGFEVLRKIQQELGGKKFPILIISGVFKTPKEISRLRQMGADGFLTKGSVIDEILYRVNVFFCKVPSKKRRHPRVFCNFPVEYSYNSHRHSSYITTLSLGGCFVRTLKPAPEGERIIVRIIIPELKKEVSASGRVAWVNRWDENRKPNTLPGMGIEFIEIPPEDRDYLEEIIRQRLEEEKLYGWHS